jgi:uncharacterized membrane protein YgcG
MTLEQLAPIYDGLGLAFHDGVHDVAGILKSDSRKRLRNAVKHCEKQLVGVNIAVSFSALGDGQSLESYGFWLLNHGEFYRGQVMQSKPDDGRGRVILLVDVENKRAALGYGYFFDGYISEKESFDVLRVGHASLLEGDTLQGCEQILITLKKLLKKVICRARKGGNV